jgi:hypothetical protein
VSATAITDGSATAAALVEFLGASVDRVIEARNSDDIRTVVEARLNARHREKIVTLTALGDCGDVPSAEAFNVVGDWLAELSPIEQRIEGARLIARKLAQDADGSAAVLALANHLATRMVRLARSRPGRPPGSDPFRGLGLEVVVSMLLGGTSPRTEREIASVLGRSHTGVHRVLVELQQRGYLVRGRDGSRIRDEIVLRDDLVGAWRGRVSVAREAVSYAARDPRGLAQRLATAAQRNRRAWRLAGQSAVAGPEGLAGGPLVIYLEGPPEPVMDAAGLVSSRAGDVVVWPVVETAILLEPRTVAGLPATNRVITYADLALVGSSRALGAAQAVWGER